jgi:hypothetical protein
MAGRIVASLGVCAELAQGRLLKHEAAKKNDSSVRSKGQLRPIYDCNQRLIAITYFIAIKREAHPVSDENTFVPRRHERKRTEVGDQRSD